MKQVRVFFILLNLAFFTCVGQHALQINEDIVSKFPDQTLLYLIDSSGRSHPVDLSLSEFKSLENEALGSEFHKFPVWVYFTAINRVEAQKFFLDIGYPMLDTVRVFFRKDSEWHKEQELGADFAFADRQVSHQHFIIPFELKRGRSVEVMLQIKSDSPIQLPLKLFSEKTVIDQLGSWDFGRGLFYGIMLAMFLYNLLISLITKDKAYYYYVAFVLFIGLTQTVLDGTFIKYVYHVRPEILKQFLIVFPALAGIAALQFAKVFLHLKSFSKILNHGMTVAQWVYAFAVVLSLIGFYQLAYRNIDIAGVLASVYAFGVAIYLSTKGHRAAYLFLLAWSFFLASIVAYVLRNLGVIEHSTFMENILHIGISTQVIFLAIALADRINTLRKEKEESQAEALRISKINERMIRDQNVMLENKVNERTLELQEANEELSVILNNLRDTQTQLVDAEKMASLGQLTAGIAHEINNPINFVSSNIKPLSRDLEDVYEIVEAYKNATGENLLEKLDRAHELREELDYDFVKEEIGELIRGIEDGANRTSEIVKGLRTFSRLDEDTLKTADLKEGISSTMVLLQSRLKDRVKVEEDYDPNVEEIECLPGKLNQVFMNILSNAIYAVTHKHYPEGVEPSIGIKTRKEEDGVKIHISDNGIGMDEDTLAKMFDPFFTTKEVGEGTGLGMSIVYKIIQKHHGTLDVNSEPGVGTEFIITLPVRQPKEFE